MAKIDPKFHEIRQEHALNAQEVIQSSDTMNAWLSQRTDAGPHLPTQRQVYQKNCALHSHHVPLPANKVTSGPCSLVLSPNSLNQQLSSSLQIGKQQGKRYPRALRWLISHLITRSCVFLMLYNLYVIYRIFECTQKK